jgi:hypothetical protein
MGLVDIFAREEKRRKENTHKLGFQVVKNEKNLCCLYRLGNLGAKATQRVSPLFRPIGPYPLVGVSGPSCFSKIHL